MTLATERVYQQLMKKILTLELEPGSIVTQAYLADLLSCGRTPLREAIQRLITMGMLVHTPNRGVQIAPLDIRDYAPAFEAWEHIHAFATRLAALRRTDEQLVELEDVLARAEPFLGEGDFAELAPLDVEFHGLLAEASQNPYLAEAAARVEYAVIRFGAVYYADHSFLPELWGYHTTVLAAVREGNPEEAERLLHAHMALARRSVLSVFASAGYLGPEGAGQTPHQTRGT